LAAWEFSDLFKEKRYLAVLLGAASGSGKGRRAR
jgi:hypothetical protein